MVPSGTSLPGLIKHLPRAEVACFQLLFEDLDVPLPEDSRDEYDDVDTVLRGYRDAVASNEIVPHCDDLDQACASAHLTRDRLSRRGVLVHMDEETARHASHADTLREQLDGSTDRRIDRALTLR